MAIKEDVVIGGGEYVQSLGGGLSFKTASNVFSIQDGQKKFVEISENGFYYYDQAQKARIILGKHPKTGEVGLWISKPNVDVEEELKK